ncbi:hypothetical protein V8G54_024885 [Vigna mungo]|uniref:Uncharacterized protein n=1 Tax=Vigna mungo TaxID=3915 RepID=A0AAQ3N6Q2_VIGMU
MALVTTEPTINEGPLFAEVDMASDFNALTVRATVIQASTIFYDTPATLGPSTLPFSSVTLSLFLLKFPFFSCFCVESAIWGAPDWRSYLICWQIKLVSDFCVQIRQRGCWVKPQGMGPSLWCFQKRLWEGTRVVPILVFLLEIARPREEKSFASIILQPLMCLVRSKIKHSLQFSC